MCMCACIGNIVCAWACENMRVRVGVQLCVQVCRRASVHVYGVRSGLLG